jgi:multidrug efflux pump subunit AcrA (membrane-fusion protein)
MDRLRAIGEWIARRKYLSTFIAIVLIGGIISVRYLLQASAGQMSEPITRGKIVDAVYGIGTVTANKRVSFNPLVGTTLKSVFVREGDRVRKGQPLVTTDDGNTYKAPFDGIANYFPYRAGENTYLTTPMLVFTDMANRYIVVSMEQQGALRVTVGQTARLSFDSLRQKTFEGVVAAVYSYSNSFLARIDLVNLPDSALPDMTCDVAVVISVHENALLIPVVAFDNGRVWVKRGKGIPHAIPVKLGVIDSTMAEVLEGDIQAGDRVMIRDKVSL